MRGVRKRGGCSAFFMDFYEGCMFIYMYVCISLKGEKEREKRLIFCATSCCQQCGYVEEEASTRKSRSEMGWVGFIRFVVSWF